MITVGIPVYNEAKFLEETLESLLMNLDDVERVIISDNASTDETERICRRYAERYQKIEYVRHRESIGLRNWTSILNMARTKYFMWLSGHDLITPNYIKSMVSLLESNEKAVVAVPIVYYFCESSADKRVAINFSSHKFNSSYLKERAQAVVENWQSCYVVNQVWRRDYLNLIVKNIKPHWIHFDLIMAMHAALLGQYAVGESSAYYYRNQRPNESKEQRKERYQHSSGQIIPDMNPLKYIPQEYCRLISHYAPDLAEDAVFKDKLLWYSRRFFDADLFDNLWRIRHGAVEHVDAMLDKEKLKRISDDGNQCFVIFGAGREGTTICKSLQSFVKVMCYIDNSVEKQKKEIAGIKVHAPSFLQHNQEKVIVVLGESQYVEEMRKEVEQKGFVYGENVYFYGDFIIE